MSEAFESIKRGLIEARRYVDGDRGEAVIHEIIVPEPDVKAIRAKTNLSQERFAASIGVSHGTIKQWEQGRRRPEGPARVLLALVDKKPGVIQETLGQKRLRENRPRQSA